jgi:hypothetical protein
MKVVALAVLSIVHVVHGCHVWQVQAHDAGPTTTVRLHHGGRITIRDSCPMDFTLAQVSGPALGLGDPVFHTGTQRTFRFARRGRYVIRATETMTSEQMGLQTLGPDNVLKLVVLVS